MVGRILERCRVDVNDPAYNDARVVDGVDLDLLSDIVRLIPVDQVRARRQRLNQFYEEVLVSADPDFGISFHTCLMILAHHNVINDSKSLRLEEFLRRRVRLQRVDEAVRRNTVIGFFDTLYWTRKLRERVKSRRTSRLDMVPRFDVPEILVDNGDSDDNDETNGDDPEKTDDDRAVMGSSGVAGRGDQEESSPMLSPHPRHEDVARAGSSASPSTPSPSSRPRQRLRIDTGVANNSNNGSNNRTSRSSSEWANISPSRMASPQERYSGMDEAVSPRQTQSAVHSRQNSARDVMQSLDSSAWGESIRRSFTQRRPTRHRPRGNQSSPANGLG